MSQLNVTFRYGTLEQYNALQNKDEGSLYFITDKNMIFRGDRLVTSRYLISGLPVGEYGGVAGVRLTDQLTGATYDIPLASSLAGFVEQELLLHYDKRFISSNAELLDSIGARDNTPGTGTFPAGRAFRVELDKADAYVELNPGQFAIQSGNADMLVAPHHSIVITLRPHAGTDAPFSRNKEMFAVIPTDLVNLVTAYDELELGKVVVGAGGRGVKTINFDGGGKVLCANAAGNALEWMSPEGIAAEVVWNSIGE